ncbi:MAG: hypothetical protein OHK0013_31250 [Sandaracinaceae bacterium]
MVVRRRAAQARAGDREVDARRDDVDEERHAPALEARVHEGADFSPSAAPESARGGLASFRPQKRNDFGSL